MDRKDERSVARRVLRLEASAFALIIAVIWLDEAADFPRRLLGAAPTPLNWRESLLESAIVCAIGAVICRLTGRLLARMRRLEGILPICASCKKIRDELGAWHTVETYVRERTAAEFTHGICPDCARREFPGYAPAGDARDRAE